jgi:hypothetical protein
MPGLTLIFQIWNIISEKSTRAESQSIFRFIQSYGAASFCPILLTTTRRFATEPQDSEPLFHVRVDL